MDTNWDCIVVGAGAAGLSAALVLGRARRRTLVVDAGGQSNLPRTGSAGCSGTTRARRRSSTRRDATSWRPTRPSCCSPQRSSAASAATRRSRSSCRTGHARSRDAFCWRRAWTTASRTLPGIEQRWGRSAFHCPFCHGWEVRDRPLGVLDRGASGVHRALLLRAWSDDVTLLADGPAELEPDDAERLRAAGVTVDERAVAGLCGPGSTLTAVAFADGSERSCGGLLVPVTLHQRSALAEQLGAAAREAGPLAADALAVDSKFATSVPGVFAAGDVASVLPSVANAVASGNSAAAMLVGSLTAEGHAVAPAAF